MRRLTVILSSCGLLASGCVSAAATDARLTAAGRTAVPLAGQSITQSVQDATECREAIMDSLVYVGGYHLYNPFVYPTKADALYGLHRRFVACMRGRGYGVVEPPAPAPPQAGESPTEPAEARR